MAKRKGGKALFEVISAQRRKGTTPLGVPGWFGQPVARPPQPPAEGGTPPAPPVRPAEPPADRPPQPDTPAWPRARQTPEKLTVAINPMQGVLVALAGIVLLGGAFLLGRHTAPSRAAGDRVQAPPRGDVADLGSRPPGVVPVPGPPGPTSQRPVQGEPRRQSGYYYLVIQGGIIGQEKARHIHDWLAARGVETTIHPESRADRWRVKDLRGFPRPKGPEIDQYVAHIEALGQEYFKVGRYDFRQNDPTGPWMAREK